MSPYTREMMNKRFETIYELVMIEKKEKNLQEGLQVSKIFKNMYLYVSYFKALLKIYTVH